MLAACDRHLRRSNRVGVDAIDNHQDALDLFDDGPVGCDVGDGFADERFALLGWEGHVDIETVRADHFAAIIAQEFGDHDDLMDAPLDIDDPVAGAERLMRSTDVVQCGLYLLVVLGMFM